MPQVALAYIGGSIGGSAIGGMVGTMIGSAIGGGLGAAASGGNFWKGALTSGVSAGLGSALGGAFGDSIGSGLDAIGIGSQYTGNVLSGLTGAATSALSGGNILQGALVGGAMPSVMSGAKNVMSSWGGGSTPGAAGGGEVSGWGANTPSLGTFDNNTQTWGTPAEGGAATESWGAQDYSITGGGNTPTLGNDNGGMTLGKVGPAASGSSPNLLQQLLGGGKDGKSNLLPTLVNAGSNMYMNAENQKQATKMAAMADPYQQYRAGDAAAYNALLQNPDSIYSDPSYMAAAKQGDEALMRQAAAMGMTDSGALTAKLSEQRMALASKFYQNRLQQLGGGAGVGNSTAAANAYGNTRTNNYLSGMVNAPSMTMASL